MRHALLCTLLLLAGCPNGDRDGPSGEVECGAPCPAGTRLASWEAMIVGQGLLVQGKECEAVCEAIAHCRPPTVPVATADSFECQALDGWFDFAPDAEVDFSWADATEVP